jgi:hypothetical protein
MKKGLKLNLPKVKSKTFEYQFFNFSRKTFSLLWLCPFEQFIKSYFKLPKISI